MQNISHYSLAEPIAIAPVALDSVGDIGAAISEGTFMSLMDAQARKEIVSPLMSALHLGGTDEDELLQAWASETPLVALRNLAEEAAQRLSIPSDHGTRFTAFLSREGTVNLTADYDLIIYQVPSVALHRHFAPIVPLMLGMVRQITNTVPVTDMTLADQFQTASDLLHFAAERTGPEIAEQLDGLDDQQMEAMFDDGEASFLYHFDINRIPDLVEALRGERELHKDAVPPAQISAALQSTRLPARLYEIGAWIVDVAQWLETNPLFHLWKDASWDVRLDVGTVIYGTDEVWPFISAEGEQISNGGEPPNLTFTPSHFEREEVLDSLKVLAEAHELLQRLNDITAEMDSLIQ